MSREPCIPPAEAPADFDACARTLLIPLAARAHAAAQWPSLDPADAHAARLLDALQADVAPFLADRHSMYGVLARTRLIRQAAARFFAEHPRGIGVALGAGLSHYHQWLDNGENRWIDVDQPPVAALRERWLPGDARRRNQAVDVTDPTWWTALGLPQSRRGPPVLLIAEGLLMYLAPGEVQRLLAAFGEHAPDGSRLLADCFSRLMVGLEWMHPSVRRTAARFRWGLRDRDEMARAHPRLALLAEEPVMDGMGPAEWFASQGVRLCTGVPFYSVYTLGIRPTPGDRPT